MGTGNSFQTPVLNTSTTYYARGEMSFSNLYGGALDNTIGSGDFFDYNQHLIFNNYSPSKLVSVLVYSDEALKVRTIELRNSTGNILQDTSIFIPNAPNGIRIYLNFTLPVQNELQLGVSGSNFALYRNNVELTYPYNIGSVVSITSSSGFFRLL